MERTLGGFRSRGSVTLRNIEYLKAVYKLGGKPGGCRVRISDLSRELGVSASTVSIMVRRLEFKGLLSVKDNYGVCLTEKGLQVLVEYIWKHAILEAVMEKAGIDANTAHLIAKSLAQHLSNDEAWVISKALGMPTHCPHGRRIPYPGTQLRFEVEYCGLD